MSHPFDVFEVRSEGAVLWLGSAASMEDAQAQIHELAQAAPSSYIILNQTTGEKIVVESQTP